MDRKNVSCRMRRLVSVERNDANITGTVKLYNATSRLIAAQSDALRSGQDTTFTIISKLDDPDAYGAERVAIYNVSLDEVPIVNWERKTIQKDEVPFTFTSHKFLETAN